MLAILTCSKLNEFYSIQRSQIYLNTKAIWEINFQCDSSNACGKSTRDLNHFPIISFSSVGLPPLPNPMHVLNYCESALSYGELLCLLFFMLFIMLISLPFLPCPVHKGNGQAMGWERDLRHFLKPRIKKTIFLRTQRCNQWRRRQHLCWKIHHLCLWWHGRHRKLLRACDTFSRRLAFEARPFTQKTACSFSLVTMDSSQKWFWLILVLSEFL